MWSDPHSGHSSEIMTAMDSGLPAESVLHTPAGEAGGGRVGKCKGEQVGCVR